MFKISTLDHLALPITDPDRSLAFYKESLGLAHLAQLGIAIAHADPNNFGARSIGSSFYITDPDGNTIELKTYAEQAI